MEELSAHFKELTHVSKVADLLVQKDQIVGELRCQLMDDYDSILDPNNPRIMGKELDVRSAAYCIDAMARSVRREVLTRFCLKLLDDYKKIFQPPDGLKQIEATDAGLEKVERRYAWLKL